MSVHVCAWETDGRTNYQFLLQSRETRQKLKPNHPRPLLGAVGKGVFHLSPPVPPCPGLAEQRQSFLADFVLAAVLPLWAGSTTKVDNCVCDSASTLSCFSCPQRAELQKGSVWSSPACTFLVRPLFPPCTTELLQKSCPPWQQSQWPTSRWFSSSWRSFRWFYISRVIPRANSAVVSYCISHWFLHNREELQ